MLRCRSLIVLLIVSSLPTVCGCGRDESHGNVCAEGVDLAAQKLPNNGQKVIEQEYNFGQVPINSKNEHRFKITNTSKKRWTVKKTHVSCSCVVSAVSSRSINPGATLEATVKFTIGNNEGRFRQDVLVEFEETSAPMFRLGVLAAVHHPISVSQKIVVVDPVQVGTREEQFVTVSNFSKEEWNDLGVTKGAEWVAVEMHKDCDVGKLSGDDAPLQLWNVALAIDGSGLPDGWNVTTLAFFPKALAKMKSELTVRAYRTPAVLVEPSTVFCGIVERGQVSKSALRFTFRGSSEVPAIDEIRVKTEKIPIYIHWRKDPEDSAALVLEGTIRTIGDTLNDELEVDFGKGRKMLIPIRGSFRDANFHGEAPRQKDGPNAGQK